MPKSINRIAANEANTGFREAMLNTHTTVPDTQHIERKDAECQQERGHNLVYLCVHSSSFENTYRANTEKIKIIHRA